MYANLLNKNILDTILIKKNFRIIKKEIKTEMTKEIKIAEYVPFIFMPSSNFGANQLAKFTKENPVITPYNNKYDKFVVDNIDKE